MNTLDKIIEALDRMSFGSHEEHVLEGQAILSVINEGVEPVGEVLVNGDTFRISKKLPPGTKLYTHAQPSSDVNAELLKMLKEIRALLKNRKVMFVEDAGGGIWTWPDRADVAIERAESASKEGS